MGWADTLEQTFGAGCNGKEVDGLLDENVYGLVEWDSEGSVVTHGNEHKEKACMDGVKWNLGIGLRLFTRHHGLPYTRRVILYSKFVNRYAVL